MEKSLAVGLVIEELECATLKFGRFASCHEGYAIILEEMDELWEAIKDKKADHAHISREAQQVAAMAIRFLIDLIDAPGSEIDLGDLPGGPS